MIARRTVLLLPLLAAACGSEPGPERFPLPNYSYLTPLRLNVATIEIDDRSTPIGGDQLMALAPVRPADALKQMAMDRLRTGGSVGRAVFVIDQAWIKRDQGGLDGRLSVHLDIYAGGDTRVGFAEATVARRRTSTDTDEDVRTVLYNFVTQMMSDMNVEFEYQVRRTLKDYLQDTAGVAPPPPPVPTQDLPPPGGVRTAPLQPPASLPTPPASAPPAPEPPAPVTMSPPPGFLHAPAY
jgi:hypothetical protein